MKWMKWFLILAVGAGVVLGIVGCSDDDDDDGGGGNPLVGTWKATSFNGQALDDSISVVVTLRSDGTASSTYSLGGATETLNGTWNTDGGTLNVTTDGETESAAYSVSGDTLTITDEEGTFTLKKQ